MTNILARHWRLVALVLGIILLLWFLYWLRTVVLPFATGLILAYLLMPLVSWLERKLPPRNKWPEAKRIISVLIAFLLLLCLIGGFTYLIVTTVIDASEKLIRSAPFFISESLLQIQKWFQDIIASLPVEIQQEINREIIEAGVDLGNAIRDALMDAVTSIPATFGMILGFAVLPFFLFYILKDSEKLKNGYVSAVSPTIARHTRNVVDIIERVLGRYIRAQIMLGVIVAYFTFIGLLVLQVPFAVALSLLAGVMEIIPTLGPWIGGGIAVIVTLAMAPDKAIWVAVLFLAVQLFENNLLVPKIQSAYLRIHPAIMITLLVFGAYIAGFWGLLLIGPLTATLVEIFKYIRDHYRAQSILEPVEPAESP